MEEEREPNMMENNERRKGISGKVERKSKPAIILMGYSKLLFIQLNG